MARRDPGGFLPDIHRPSPSPRARPGPVSTSTISTAPPAGRGWSPTARASAGRVGSSAARLPLPPSVRCPCSCQCLSLTCFVFFFFLLLLRLLFVAWWLKRTQSGARRSLGSSFAQASTAKPPANYARPPASCAAPAPPEPSARRRLDARVSLRAQLIDFVPLVSFGICCNTTSASVRRASGVTGLVGDSGGLQRTLASARLTDPKPPARTAGGWFITRRRDMK